MNPGKLLNKGFLGFPKMETVGLEAIGSKGKAFVYGTFPD